MPGILVDSLVGIDPDLAGMSQEVRPLRRQPAVEQIMGQPLAQPDLEDFLQPRLRNDQHQQDADDHAEHQELAAEDRQIVLLQGIEEVALPDIQPDLPDHIGAQHDDDADGEQSQPPPVP
jgi:hypothetical protein